MARPREFDRSKVLIEAMIVFWRQGYEATTLDDLTTAMNIKRQSLYNSFGDKHSLYLEALGHYRTLRAEGLLACLSEGPVRKGFDHLFACIIREAVDDAECKGCMMVNAMTELAAADPAVREIVDNAERENEAVFAEAIRRGQARGEIAESKNSRALAAFLYNVVIGLQVRARKNSDGGTLEGIVELALAALD